MNFLPLGRDDSTPFSFVLKPMKSLAFCYDLLMGIWSPSPFILGQHPDYYISYTTVLVSSRPFRCIKET